MIPIQTPENRAAEAIYNLKLKFKKKKRKKTDTTVKYVTVREMRKT